VKATVNIPRIVIAGAASNVGKTTIAAGLIATLRDQGLVVQPFKCGPDYVDPSYHERAAGRPCRNLDIWMLNEQQLRQGFARACRDADVAVIEGVMGLFDGSNWHDEQASTAHIAKLLGAPVLLVVNISGAARSAAIPVLGCRQFDPDLALRGVVLNFAGSESHAHGCAEAIRAIAGLPVLGWLPRDARLQIPERHLGLVPGGEQHESEALIREIATEVSRRFDLATVIELARSAEEWQTAPEATAATPARHLERPTIAVARDEAFCFYYPENLELLAEAGATIEFFSPLQGERPSPHADGVYLGGGYPELHGPALAANGALWDALAELHQRDAPIYAECGGFMVLTQALIDRDGERWPMAGLVPGETRMGGKLAAVGYRHATARCSNLLTEAGNDLRGHEFRYSNWVCADPAAGEVMAWRVRGTRVQAPGDSGGFVRGNLLASYLHIHFGQHVDIASRFISILRGSRRP
jgi:cobyrinic acid a,c-diamide synthase